MREEIVEKLVVGEVFVEEFWEWGWGGYGIGFVFRLFVFSFFIIVLFLRFICLRVFRDLVCLTRFVFFYDF